MFINIDYTDVDDDVQDDDNNYKINNSYDNINYVLITRSSCKACAVMCNIAFKKPRNK
jgi:hypothetical protein